MLPFWIALQFLSSLPVRLPGMPAPREMGRSLLCYPLVGLFSGCCCGWPAICCMALRRPCTRLCCWRCGCCSAAGCTWMAWPTAPMRGWGGFGDRERTLQIMKDPRSGPIAVVTLVLVLLLKFCALWVLVERGAGGLLVLAPVVGRAAMLGLFLGTPYVRAGGLGAALAEHLPRRGAIWVLLVSALAGLALGGWAVLWPLLAALVVFVWLRQLMCRRLGGTTGDTAGALLELLELTVVVTLALRA